ncbi:MAG: imidazoleglycerol-phosphate dehydratase [Candidatus Omnitrophica bacterium]|jgi:imidazoleglycerol-phosphate dehydratase|nr:imidazoleglycerol-phosphate dehydratase [Candidatus Omnitrophota bacterium]
MRKAEKNRISKETNITIKLNIDGEGIAKINSGIGFLDHMLELFAFWGHFDLEVNTREADLRVDIHHTNEDIGIVLGQVFKEALGDKAGIRRIGSASVPMEDMVADVVVDISGRGFFQGMGRKDKTGDNEYSFTYAEHFFEAFSKNLGMNLSIKLTGANPDLHTNLEPVFKALGIALDQATQIDPRRKGIPSTKGVID